MIKNDAADLVAAELTFAKTEDGIVHGGALFRPAHARAAPIALVWVHGAGQNFYSPSYLRIGRAVTAAGYPFISVNTRGHDIAATVGWTAQSRVLRGSGWDRFDECPLDIASWIERAADLGWPRVITITLSNRRRSLSGSGRIVGNAATVPARRRRPPGGGCYPGRAAPVRLTARRPSPARR